MRIWPLVALVAVLSSPAMAGDIPLDDAGFTAYVQARLQLYMPRPLRSDAPLTARIDLPVAATTFDFHAVRARCAAKPEACDDAVHDYVQQAVRDVAAAQQAAVAPPPPAPLPSDRDAFVHEVAARAGAAAPQLTVVADGTNLVVTRPGGHPFKTDVLGLYTACRQQDFNCAPMVAAFAARFRDLLDLPARDQLRAAPNFVRGCEVIASVGNTGWCKITPSTASMSAFFRRAFSYLGEWCFKETPHGMEPMINADRADLGLGLDDALDVCAAETHKILPPLAARLDAASGAGVMRVETPYASAYVFYPADWSGFAAATGGHFLVAVPARDTLLVVKGDDEAAQRTLAAATFDIATHARFGIGTDVYRWTGDGFALGTARSTMLNGPPLVHDSIPRAPWGP